MNKKSDYSLDEKSLPKAQIKPSRLSWMLWLIPLGAAMLCGWFVYRDFVATGPTITLLFENADGIEPKNTQLKYLGASVGIVKAIELTADQKHVKVTAQLVGSARSLSRAGSVFWIVRPEVSIGSISGLRTIVSGDFIEVRPGNGTSTNYFVGVEKEPPVQKPGALPISIVTDNLGSLQEQSPIFYRGIQVGEVLYFQLADDAKSVMIHARVWAEYTPLVREESKFWNAGGFDMRVGLFKGVQISAQSPRTIISGGIEFATPPDAHTPAPKDYIFPLNQKAEDSWKAWSPEINLHLPDHAQSSPTNESPASLLQK